MENSSKSSPIVICHWGIKGQKWGVRRFENSDGTLTDEGKKRYSRYERRHMSVSDMDESELARLSKARDRAKAVGVMGAIAGAAVGSFTPDLIRRGADSVLIMVGSPSWISRHKYVLYRDNFDTIATAAGMAIGATAGYKIARDAAIRAQGYTKQQYKDGKGLK